MNTMGRIRWMVDVTKWTPDQDTFCRAMSLIQPEERKKSMAFVFQRDVKTSIVGRLLLRCCVLSSCDSSLTNDDLLIERTNEGKPILSPTTSLFLPPAFGMNVSHQGRLVVCASDIYGPLGVDVMKLNRSPDKRCTDEYFRIMDKTFSPSEWTYIRGGDSDEQKIRRFMRVWTLKEAFVKGEGTGISRKLDIISFNAQSDMETEQIVTDTTLEVDGVPKTEWIFHESLMGGDHYISVGAKVKEEDKNHFSPIPFSIKTVESLVHLLQSKSTLNRPDDFVHDWTSFQLKDFSPQMVDSTDETPVSI